MRHPLQISYLRQWSVPYCQKMQVTPLPPLGLLFCIMQSHHLEFHRTRNFSFKPVTFMLLALVVTYVQSAEVDAQRCRASGRTRGRKPPPRQCYTGDESDCCVKGKMYPIYRCSLPVSGHTRAHLTLNSFEKGKDGGGPSECDDKYHSDDLPIVALSTGWFDNMNRCHHSITINGNRRSEVAMVVEECDLTMGCDLDHNYRPPCDYDIVDASRAVWEALGVPKDNWGWMDIRWSDA